MREAMSIKTKVHNFRWTPKNTFSAIIAQRMCLMMENLAEIQLLQILQQLRTESY